MQMGQIPTISTAVGALPLGPDVTCEIQAGGNMKNASGNGGST